MMRESKALFDALMVTMIFTSGGLVQAKSFTNTMMLITNLLIIIVIVISAIPDINLDASTASQ